MHPHDDDGEDDDCDDEYDDDYAGDDAGGTSEERCKCGWHVCSIKDLLQICQKRCSL